MMAEAAASPGISKKQAAPRNSGQRALFVLWLAFALTMQGFFLANVVQWRNAPEPDGNAGPLVPWPRSGSRTDEWSRATHGASCQWPCSSDQTFPGDACPGGWGPGTLACSPCQCLCSGDQTRVAVDVRRW